MNRRHAAGFTLLELLVAMTVLSLIALVMLGGLSFGTTVWKRTQDSSEAADSIGVAQSLMRRQLSAIYPQWQDGVPEAPHIQFDGGPDRVAFLSAPPAQLRPGPHLPFALERSAQGTLDLVWRPTPSSGAGTSSVLLSNVASVAFAYYGPALHNPKSDWFDSWTGRARLPTLIRVRVAFPPGDERVWPELVVHPDIVVDVRCIYEPVTRTCRGRPE